jgi:hypothetical protein
MFDLMLAHTSPREVANDTLRRFARVGVAPAAAAVMQRELPVNPKPAGIWVDGTQTTAFALIKLAREYGYCGDGGMFRTSEAAAVLRDAGFEVTDTPPEGR